jgi:hypothetical protein
LEQESADFQPLALGEYFLRHLWGRFFCFAQFDYSRYHSVLLKPGCEIPTYAIGVILQLTTSHPGLGVRMRSSGVPASISKYPWLTQLLARRPFKVAAVATTDACPQPW